MYHYVKGKGWTLGPEYKTVTFKLECGALLLCENREPRDGEDWFAEGNFDQTAKHLSRYWTAVRIRNLKGSKYYHGDPSLHLDPGYCVFKLL